MENSRNDNMPTNYTATVRYIKMGWAIIPVEGLQSLDSNRCLCGKYPCGIGNRNAGKHPAVGRTGWQNGPALSFPDAYEVFVVQNPNYNVGARTGNASGFFALDVEAGGLEELYELEAIHGPLPPTRIHRTGGGGKHYLFNMPDFDVRNSQKKLSANIDIRGNGGMIVLPPSVSAKGAYGIESDEPIADAPQWLLNWLRNQHSQQVPPPPEMPVIEDLPEYAGLPEERQQQCQRYAKAVIEREANNYRHAPPGTGNAELYKAACNILEIVQSPWNTFGYHHLDEYLESARQSRIIINPGRGQNKDEYTKTLMSARGATIGKGRPLPPDPHESLMFGFPPQPNNPNNPFTTPNSLHFSDDASTPVVDPADALLGEMLSLDELDSIEMPQPLIEDVLDMDSETWLVAPSGSFKSFVALDWALHVGSGMQWRGRKTQQGTVLYIVAEGSKGIRMRVKAWEKMNKRKPADVKFLTRPVQAGDPQAWAVLVEASRRLQPTMIIIDTQARVTVGMEENSATEMGEFVNAVSQLRQATGACVLVVHHPGKEGGGARGSSALHAAMDTEIMIERPEKREERLQLTAKITTGKQKDMGEDIEFDIQMEIVDLGVDESTGRKLSSLALKPYDPFAQPPPKLKPDHIVNLTENQASVLEVLREHANHDGGATVPEISVFIRETKPRPIPRSSLTTALTKLMNDGFVVKSGSRWILQEHVLG